METLKELPKHIAKCAELLAQVVTNTVSDVTEPAMNFPLSETAFEGKYTPIKTYLEGLAFDYRIEPPEETNDESDTIAAEIRSFNDQIDAKTRYFVASRAIETVLGNLLNEIVDKYVLETKIDPQTFDPLSVFLDFIIHVVVHEESDLKRLFYSSLCSSVTVLLNVADALQVFWNYFESRLSMIERSIFNRAVVGDRISILEICNPITDQFYVKQDKKFNSYKKDSFNDQLHARVRLFVNKLFSLEDNTGLNKFFSVANRSVPIELSRKKRDDFMSDILECHKIFNDPYLYLRQGRADLNKASLVFNRVCEQLAELEEEHAKRLPKVEPNVVNVKPMEVDKTYLTEKYSKKLYIPENYWTTGFNKDAPDQAKQDTQKFHYDLFELSDIRRYYLVLIYIVSNLYYELKAQHKRDLLKLFNCPPGTKHIVDDATPDMVSKLFAVIRRELPKIFKSIDVQFMYTLQHIATVEVYWYGWLIYGKDAKTNKPLFADKKITQGDIESVVSKFPTINAVKEKRYFNVYATPQLSRKMRTPTGLTNVQVTRFTEDELATKIHDSMDTDELQTLFKWRQLRFSRLNKWLKFDDLLDDLVLPLDKNLVKKTSPPEPEKSEVSESVSRETSEPAEEAPAPKRLKLE